MTNINVQIVSTLCLSIISWKISPPERPTNLLHVSDWSKTDTTMQTEDGTYESSRWDGVLRRGAISRCCAAGSVEAEEEPVFVLKTL